MSLRFNPLVFGGFDLAGTEGKEGKEGKTGPEGKEGKTGPEGKLPAGGELGQPLVRASEAEKGEWLPKVTGGAAASGTLTLEGTTSATKGKILFGASSAYNEEANVQGGNRLGIGTTTPNATLNVANVRPESVTGSTGTEAVQSVGVEPVTGGNTTIATIGLGGKGSSISAVSGTGGQATTAKETATGGEGGSFLMSSGLGGAEAIVGGQNCIGGPGGVFAFTAGNGGKAEKGTVTNEGGAGGKLTFTGGTGGNVTAGTGTRKGGEGGTVKFVAGKGGTGTSGGKGGSIVLEVGAEGGGTGGGPGSIELKGATLLNKGIGLWAHAAPATQHARIAKVEEASALDTLLQLIEKTNEAVKKLNEITQEVLPEYGATA